MIVDCFTHTWDDGALGDRGEAANEHPRESSGRSVPLSADPATHRAAAEPVDITFVLGFASRYLEAEISNDAVADYVRSNADRMIGFAGIEPGRPKEAIAEIARARDELRLSGVAVSPAAQGFHPTDSQAMLVYAEAVERSMPIIFHTGPAITVATKLEYARPVLLDEVARELPDGRILIAHMGYPWMNETILLLAKHPNVYAEVSWLVHQPWQAYQAMLSAYQYGVTDKLLFGSGFPRATASQCIESLYSVNHLVHGTSLPTIPREALRGIVERDALSLLGIAQPADFTCSTPPLEGVETH